MKLLIFLSALVAASLSQPVVRTWTLNQLSAAIEKRTNEDMKPYLVDALNQIMYALFTGNDEDVHALIPSPTGNKTWTGEQLKKALVDKEIDPNYQPFILRALHQLSYMHAEGNDQNSVEVAVPALDISVWTVSDVQEAKGDPNTKRDLLPYLEKAENQIQNAIKEGQKKEDAKGTLVTPVGLVPVEKGTFPDIISRNVL